MRLIDADELKTAFPTCDNSKPVLVASVRATINHMPTIEPQESRWIPCSERMPELDSDGYSDKVLVCFSNFPGVEICEYRVMNGTGKWYSGDTDDSPEDIGVNVIAWMPLPEPYKEEKA